MQATNQFVGKFKYLVILANLHSVYVPGLKFSRWFYDPFFGFCMIMNIASLICVADMAAVWYLVPSITFELKCIIFSSSFAMLFNTILRIYFTIKKDKMDRLLCILSQCINPQLWPEISNEITAVRINKFPKWVYLGIACSAMVLVVGMVKVCVSKTVYIPSIFLADLAEGTYDEGLAAPAPIILLQMITFYFTSGSWIACEVIMELLFKAVIAQLEYLNQVMMKIMSVVDVTNEGHVFHVEHNVRQLLNVNEKEILMNITRNRVKLWTKYHIQVIRMCKLVEDFVMPLSNGKLAFLAIAICGLFFVTIKGILRPDVIVVVFTFCLTRMVITYRLCRCGDMIAEMGTNLAKTTDGIGFDRNIQKTLLLIGEITRREMIGKTRTILPINSDTFMALLNLQYRFLTFMQNLSQRATHNTG